MAAIYPDMQFYLFFHDPGEGEMAGLADGLYFLYTIAQAFLPAYGGGIFGVIYQSNAIAAACVHP